MNTSYSQILQRSLAGILSLTVLSLLMGCQLGKKATVTSQQDFAAPPTNRPTVIYVADFDLPPSIIQHQEGLLSNRQGPASRVANRLYGSSSDPEARARQLVELMSKTLIKDLSNAGFNTLRLAPSQPLPKQGWLLRGSFSLVQEGNRLQRSMVGLGQGETDIRVLSCLNDLSQGLPRPLYEVATDANSGNKVGAAPTMAFGPYGAAVAFVRAGQDVEKNIKQTASQIASQATSYVQKNQTGGRN